MVDTRGNPESPGVICKEERRDAAFISSFEEEKEAMSMTITLASSNCDKALICLFYQSLLRAIASGSESVTDIIPLIRQSSVDIMMQWVPGYCGLSSMNCLTNEQSLLPWSMTMHLIL